VDLRSPSDLVLSTVDGGGNPLARRDRCAASLTESASRGNQVASAYDIGKVGRMPELQRLAAGHAPRVLAFELANRAYFAASISDRGDDYFEHFAERYNALLAEQAAGVCAFYVLVAEDGSVLGRFNLVDIEDDAAALGYRVAQHAAGRGVATAAVLELCRIAAAQHGLRTLRAATTHQNVASQKVLMNAGFDPIGPADPAHIGGKSGTWYQRDLTGSTGFDRTVGKNLGRGVEST
jgi:ribosomal-protein-alanine N-acetyltransferase